MARSIRREPYIIMTNGVWFLSVHEEGKRKRRYTNLHTSDKAVAESRLETYKERLRIGVVETPIPRAGYTAVQGLDDYFKEHVLTKVVDRVRQENVICHLKAFFQRILLTDVDIPTCRAYRDARAAGLVGGWNRKRLNVRPASDGTIRRELNTLRAAANHAVRWKRITKADLPTFELPAGTPVAKEEGFLTKNEIATLIFMAEGDLRDFILFIYLWGARRNSVESLTAAQINFSANRVNLQKMGAAITKKRKPMVPIFPEMCPLLERRAADAKAGRLFRPGGNYYMRFKKFCIRLGMPYSHPHVLRHSRASHLLMDGHSIYKVARLLGDSVQTVEKVYGHHSTEFLMEGFR